MSNELGGARELAEFAHKLGAESRELDLMEFPLFINKIPAALIPGGMKVESLEGLIPANPRIKEVSLKMYEPASFIRYVNEHKSPHTRIFANIQAPPYTFVAVIDWHETGPCGKADWCKHTVTLELGLSDNYKTWKKRDGEFLEQAVFAEFLKDNRLDIMEPNNAHILELVMGLEATSEAKYNSKLATNKGVTLSYSESVTATANGQRVDVPEDITLKIPVFTGMDEFDVKCDFKFRASGGAIVFAYRMIGVDRLIRETVRSASAKLEKEIELPVFI